MSTKPLRVGLVGAGPWAELAHAPVLTGGPETELVGIWGRRPEASAALAERFASRSFTDYDQLLAECDAVAFAVPPEVQGRMALTAARAGKHLLLDKPVAESLASAQRLADAVAEAGVSSMVLLTLRFTEAFRRFLPAAQAISPIRATYTSLSDAFLEGPFSQSPWRHEKGILTDVGPHVVDALSSLLGPVVSAEASTVDQVVWLKLRHEGEGMSQATLSAHYAGPRVNDLAVAGRQGELACDWTVPDSDRWGVVRREFADAVRTGAPHPCDVHRGVELERVLAMVTG
ncbi:MAG: dehydrogenase [Frankiales bacterium]|nr:dehydrogenase [Frankiales bacterium]